MKKLLAIVLALALVLALAGCLNKNGDTPDGGKPPVSDGDPDGSQTPPEDGDGKTDGGDETGGNGEDKSDGDENKTDGDGNKTDGEDKDAGGEDKTDDSGGDGGEQDPAEGGSLKLALTPGSAGDALALVSAEGWEVTAGSSAAEGLKAGSYDAAVVSLSDAAKLYRETGGAVDVAALLTSGGWLVAERGDTLSDMLGLAGKVVYAPRNADEAVAVLGYIGLQYGFDLGDTLVIEPVDDAASQDVALLPDGGMGDGQRTALSLLTEWTNATGSELLPGMVLAVRSDLEQEALDGLLAALEAAVSASSDTEVTKFVFITGADELWEALEGHLERLYGVNPEVVGGSIPDDGFFR